MFSLSHEKYTNPWYVTWQVSSVVPLYPGTAFPVVSKCSSMGRPSPTACAVMAQPVSTERKELISKRISSCLGKQALGKLKGTTDAGHWQWQWTKLYIFRRGKQWLFSFEDAVIQLISRYPVDKLYHVECSLSDGKRFIRWIKLSALPVNNWALVHYT